MEKAVEIVKRKTAEISFRIDQNQNQLINLVKIPGGSIQFRLGQSGKMALRNFRSEEREFPRKSNGRIRRLKRDPNS